MKAKITQCSKSFGSYEKHYFNLTVCIEQSEEEITELKAIPIPEELKELLKGKNALMGFDVDDFLEYVEAYKPTKELHDHTGLTEDDRVKVSENAVKHEKAVA